MNNNKLIVRMPWNFRARHLNQATVCSTQQDVPTPTNTAVEMPRTLRPRKLVNEGTSSAGISRSATFNRQVKDRFPERYDAFRAKDALRERNKYVTIEQKSARVKKEAREKWKMAKRAHRGQPGTQQSETRTLVKERTIEDKRERARLRQQKCREKLSRQCW